MDPALVVVDVQQGFDDADYWGPRNNPACEANVAALIAHWREQGGRSCSSVTTPTRPQSPLRPDHPGNAFKDVVTGEPDVLVTKQTNSCFYGEPDLHAWLQRARHQRARPVRHHDQPLLRDDRADGREPRAMTSTSCSTPPTRSTAATSADQLDRARRPAQGEPRRTSTGSSPRSVSTRDALCRFRRSAG